MKPENVYPLKRYGIHRERLMSEGGLPSELVDRVYKSLFVYSVGFYELMKDVLEHAKGRYAFVTSIWKTFSILLEYCCRTDYKIVI